MPSHPRPRRALVPLLGVAAIACVRPGGASRSGPAAPAPAPLGDACALGPPRDSVPVPEILTVGVAGPVDPAHAPVPTNDAERFVFRQLFETLIRVDCGGAVVPGLAESGSPSGDGRGWTFTLRRGARVADGLSVTARDVIASWSARDGLPRGTEVSVEGERALSVRLSDPLILADPSLAVARAVNGRAWLVGTGG